MALASLERRRWLHQRLPQSGSVGFSLLLGLHRVASTLGELSSSDQIPDCLAVTDAGQHWRCLAMAVRYRSHVVSGSVRLEGRETPCDGGHTGDHDDVDA